jgi:CheY-like chemotaxis protein
LKPRILVVEDNLLNRELLRDWLEVDGFEVWTAFDLQTSYEVSPTAFPMRYCWISILVAITGSI